ncbi:BTAD domain-containing putative transcriptional regulator [Streptomyces coeruleorubidus]|uniref:AfsR/SARP family transcriptional regulator n=1 Tax=Streptomyces coeruleorubidus TaxID=116188 RepID=UPI00379C15AB
MGAIRDGEEVVLGPPKQRAVLGLLAGRVNQTVGVDQIVDAVWGDEAPATAANGVHTYVAGLRRALEPGRGRREPGGILVSSGRGYSLCVDPDSVDARRFERCLSQARRLWSDGQQESACSAYAAALELWRGTAYSGIPGPFAERERRRLHELKIETVEEWATASLALGKHENALDVLSRYAPQEPLREKLQWLLMLALYRCGRRARALEVYQETRQVLDEELGIEPGAGLQELHELILGESPDLDIPSNTQRPAVPTGHVAAAYEGTATPSAARPLDPLVQWPVRLPARTRGFVGRERESAALADFILRERAEPRGRTALAVIEGPPGVGKTALALHLGHRLAGHFPDGQLFVDLCASSQLGDSLSVMEALSSALRNLGVTDDRMPPDLTDRTALFRSLLYGKRVLMVLDDALGAEQVRSLVPHGPSCVLVTSRRRQSGLAVRDGAFTLELDALSARESADLLLYRLGEHRVRGHHTAVARLVEQCERIPLALRIVAEVLIAHPEVSIAELAEEHRTGVAHAVERNEVVPHLRAAFATSYHALAEGTARAFRLLGLYDRPVITVPAAAALFKESHSSARWHLDMLADTHLLVESGGETYRFPPLIGGYAAECAAQEPAAERVAARRRLAAQHAEEARLFRRKAG